MSDAHDDDDDRVSPFPVTSKRRRLPDEGTLEVYVYAGAQHGFHCDERGSFHEASAKAAWQRAVDFLKKHLKK
jgi:dienelactone hydrolase